MKNKSSEIIETQIILLGIVILFIVYLLVLLIDLFFFPIQNWTSGGDSALKESFFWTQYVRMCPFLSIKYSNYFILFIGSIGAGLATGYYFKNKTNETKVKESLLIRNLKHYSTFLISSFLLSITLWINARENTASTYGLFYFFIIIQLNILVFSSIYKRYKWVIVLMIVIIPIYTLSFVLLVVGVCDA